MRQELHIVKSVEVFKNDRQGRQRRGMLSMWGNSLDVWSYFVEQKIGWLRACGSWSEEGLVRATLWWESVTNHVASIRKWMNSSLSSSRKSPHHQPWFLWIATLTLGDSAEKYLGILVGSRPSILDLATGVQPVDLAVDWCILGGINRSVASRSESNYSSLLATCETAFRILPSVLGSLVQGRCW